MGRLSRAVFLRLYNSVHWCKIKMLRQLSELSVGFFFGKDPEEEKRDSFVVRGYERNCLRVTPEFVCYALCPDPKKSAIFPENL